MAYLLYVNTLLTSIRRIVDFMEQFQRGITASSASAKSWMKHPISRTRPTPWN